MKILYKKKIYNGMVELRDYEVKHALMKNKPIKVVVEEEYMILTPSALKRGKTTGIWHSKFNMGQTYSLIGFEWKGTLFKEPDINIDMNVRQRLAKEFKKKHL